MKKILTLTAVLMTCAQCMQAEANDTAVIPSAHALEQQLAGRRMASDDMPKGSFLNFLDGGILKEENRGRPDELAKWEVKGQTVCLENERRRSCADVVKFTNTELVLRVPSGSEDGQLWEGYFVNETGMPLRDVIAFDGKLARTLHGRTITAEDAKGKTIWGFDAKGTVTIEAFDASGFPFPGGSASYDSKEDDLCITPENNKVVCMRVKISGNNVKMIPLIDGVLQEKEAMAGIID
ncbi:hypothetical protein [Pseudophaeobacter sp.]|uniref:hypothetical protein n=1 Tax=Pseudophaeobacter sp. TaxID=1971739 RepID=UPI003298F823